MCILTNGIFWELKTSYDSIYLIEIKLILKSTSMLLFSAGGDGRFEVDRKNGQVRTTGLPLQREREYLLTVLAADRLGSRSAPVVVSVVAGARPPQFTNVSFTIAIPENTPEGQS